MGIFRIVNDSEKSRFNEFVAQANGHATQSFTGSDPERLRGWQPVKTVLEESGQIVATMVAVKKPLPFFPNRYLLDVINGPVADFSNKEVDGAVLAAVVAFAKAQHAVCIKINPFVERSAELNSCLLQQRFLPSQDRWRFRCTLRLDLTRPEVEIYQGFDFRTQRRIRQAIKQEVQISGACTERDITDFIHLHAEICLRKDFSGRSPDYLRALCELDEPTQLFVAREDDRAYSALLAYTFGGRMVLAYSGSASTCPPYVGRLLQWRSIQWGIEQGFKEYDFGGIPVDPQPGNTQWGVYNYKRLFGGYRVCLTEEHERYFSAVARFSLPLAKKISSLMRQKSNN
jgi:peptidoglycan pentaglycine glycine transferase (the first glycine)